MASFQKKFKNTRFVSTRCEIENSKKIAKKFKKFKNTITASFQAKEDGQDWEMEKIKINVLFRSCSTRYRKFQKNSKKFKKLRNSILAFFQAKIDWGRQRKRENKNCRFVPFRSYPTRNLKFQKNINKIEKIKRYHYGFISSF